MNQDLIQIGMLVIFIGIIILFIGAFSAAMKEKNSNVKFSVFGLFGFLISFIFGLIPYAGGILVSFLAPLFVLPSYLLYRDLSAGFNDPGTV